MNGIHEVTGSTPVWSTIPSPPVFSEHPLNAVPAPDGVTAPGFLTGLPAGAAGGRAQPRPAAGRRFGPYRSSDGRWASASQSTRCSTACSGVSP